MRLPNRWRRWDLVLYWDEHCLLLRVHRNTWYAVCAFDDDDHIWCYADDQITERLALGHCCYLFNLKKLFFDGFIQGQCSPEELARREKFVEEIILPALRAAHAADPRQPPPRELGKETNTCLI